MCCYVTIAPCVRLTSFLISPLTTELDINGANAAIWRVALHCTRRNYCALPVLAFATTDRRCPRAVHSGLLRRQARTMAHSHSSISRRGPAWPTCLARMAPSSHRWAAWGGSHTRKRTTAHLRPSCGRSARVRSRGSLETMNPGAGGGIMQVDNTHRTIAAHAL